MSDASNAHEGPIKTPKQLGWAVFFAFLVPIIGIILLTNYVAVGTKPGAGAEVNSEEAIANRLRPIGSIQIKEAPAAGVVRTGEDVYKAQCAACHATGALGSPKFQDAAAWGPRIGQGYEALLTSALKGKNAMTPQGGGDYSDVEIGRAVVYMANAGGAKFEEPKAPEAAASK